jgi:hypothetical protein
VRHHRLRQRDRAAQPHHAAWLGTQFVDRFLRRARLFQYRAAVGVEALADLGDHEAARGPLQQPHAQAFLQLGHALAQPRLGHAQCASGGRETAVLDHHGEEVQVVEVLQRAVEGHGVLFLCRNDKFNISRLIRSLSQNYLVSRRRHAGLRLESRHETAAYRFERAG